MIDKNMVLIKWFDAKIYPGMHQVEEALNRKMDMFESLGYLIERNDRTTIMAHEVTERGEYRDVLLIPSGSIVSHYLFLFLFQYGLRQLGHKTGLLTLGTH